jgi:hypothetical protein
MKKIMMYALAALMLAGTFSAAAYSPKNSTNTAVASLGEGAYPRQCPMGCVDGQ